MNDDLQDWFEVKQKLRARNNPPTFKEREIWWCSVGLNVGFELYGKGKIFTRPVLVVKKFNKNTFLGIPLSTKLKDITSYHKIELNGKEVSVVFDQVKTIDAKRLANKLEVVSEKQFENIKSAFKDFL